MGLTSAIPCPGFSRANGFCFAQCTDYLENVRNQVTPWRIFLSRKLQVPGDKAFADSGERSTLSISILGAGIGLIQV